MSLSHTHFLRDLGLLIREAALTAAQESQPPATGNDFAKGRAMAWYEIASLIQQQAIAFGIAPGEVGLEGFDAERDLLSPKS